MVIDWYTKAVLTVIAIALTGITLNPWISPSEVRAEATSILYGIQADVGSIGGHVFNIANGTCVNGKIC